MDIRTDAVRRTKGRRTDPRLCVLRDVNRGACEAAPINVVKVVN